MTKEDVSKLVREEYEGLRSILIDSTIAKADIQVDVLPEKEAISPNQLCCYFPDLNKLRMVFFETEIDNDYAMLGSPMMGVKPVWKTYLTHEVVHEYQYKCVKAPTSEGQKLMQNFPNRFEGNGHDENFYTAVCECAAKLNLDAETFLKSI